MTKVKDSHNELVPALVMDELYKSFGNLEVLRGVSISADKGDIISVIGASGSGKSPMLRCINLLELPDSGNIWIAGELNHLKRIGRKGLIPESSKQIERIRSTVDMVFQDFNLWSHMTVMQNVVEAPRYVLKQTKSEASDRAGFILNRVGLFEKKDEYPAHLSGE